MKQIRPPLLPARDELEQVDSGTAALVHGHNWFDASVSLAGYSADCGLRLSYADLRWHKPNGPIVASGGTSQESLP